MHILCNLYLKFKIRFHNLVYHPDNRISGRVVFGFLRVYSADADRFIPAMHNPILDLECHSDDFMDSITGTEWSGEFDTAEYWTHGLTRGMASLFWIFSDFGICTSLYAVHGCANF